jgi:hypothetical protein
MEIEKCAEEEEPGKEAKKQEDLVSLRSQGKGRSIHWG